MDDDEEQQEEIPQDEPTEDVNEVDFGEDEGSLQYWTELMQSPILIFIRLLQMKKILRENHLLWNQGQE